MDVQIDIND